MKRRHAPLAALLVLLIPSLSRGGAPVTKEQLLQMVEAKVDTDFILAVVERDCVDFDIDGSNLTQLFKSVPKPVLTAIIDCRSGKTGGAPPAPEVGAPAPSATAPTAPTGALPLSSSLNVAFTFLAESDPLTCDCQLDGVPWGSVTKPQQGEFGAAVSRDPVRLETGFSLIPPGNHTVTVRCDPGKKSLSTAINAKAGSKYTLVVNEGMFRTWKIKGVKEEAQK
jgi:hypothetical protein